MDDDRAHPNDTWQPPARKGGFAGVFQRIVLGRQAPAPFRESDFESEWHVAGADPAAGPLAD